MTDEEHEDEEYEEEIVKTSEPEKSGGTLLWFVLIPTIIAMVYFGYSLIFGGIQLGGLIGTGIAVILGLGVLFSSFGVNKQWEEAIILKLGKFNRKVGAGIYFKIPFIESVIWRDTRIRVMDIEPQRVLTKDNVSVNIDGVVYMKVVNTKKSILNIEDYRHAVMNKSQVTLKNISGQYELDGLLAKREEIAKEIKKQVDKHVEAWGIDIQSVELQNIKLEGDMERIMARQAEAEREKRAVVIKSTGELEAAKNLKLAADELLKTRGAMELRRLSTLSDISQDQSNTIVFAVPLEALRETMSATSGLQVPKSKKSK